MNTYKNFKNLYLIYNGPIPAAERLRALFDSDNRYECARAALMVQHLSQLSSALINTIGRLGQDSFAKTQRIFFRQELTDLLRQRREWKHYRQSLAECAPI
jgi:hypothetical protein